MLSAPVGVIALGLVFVQIRSGEPTQSLFARWPDTTQISKCEVRPATPLEISQGADFGVTMQTVSPENPRSINGLRYSISEPATKSKLKGVWSDERAEFREAAHLLQQDYHVSQSIAAFNRRELKAADGVIEVDIKVGRGKRVYPAADKVFRLDTKTILLPDVNAARKANFRITDAALSNDHTARLIIDDYSEEPNGLISFPQTVGKWTMEGDPDADFTASIGSWGSMIQAGKTIPFIEVWIRFPKPKQPSLVGRKFRGLISLGRGWPQEVTLEWPEKIVFDGTGPEVKFTAKLAPLPK